MASPTCLACQEDVHDKRSRCSLQETSKEALLYMDAHESYIQHKGLSLTAAELVAGAQWAGTSVFVATHQSQLIITAGPGMLDCCTRNVNFMPLILYVKHLVMRCAHVKGERGKLVELMDERVEGMARYGREWEGGSSDGQSVQRSSSRKSYGEIILEEVYIANGSHPSTRSWMIRLSQCGLITDLFSFLFYSYSAAWGTDALVCYGTWCSQIRNYELYFCQAMTSACKNGGRNRVGYARLLQVHAG